MASRLVYKLMAKLIGLAHRGRRDVEPVVMLIGLFAPFSQFS